VATVAVGGGATMAVGGLGHELVRQWCFVERKKMK